MRRRWIAAEFILLALSVTRALAQSGTESAATVPENGSDLNIAPGGLGLPTWVLFILGTTGVLTIGNSVVDLVKSGAKGARAWSDDLPDRLKSEGQRRDMETQQLGEQVTFTRTINEELTAQRKEKEQLRSDLNAMQSNHTQMIANMTEQQNFTLRLQQAMLDQNQHHDEAIAKMQADHKAEIDVLKAQMATMSETIQGKDRDIETALETARDWKSKYEAEKQAREQAEARANDAEARAQQLLEKLRKYETGESAAVTPTAALEAKKEEPHGDQP